MATEEAAESEIVSTTIRIPSDLHEAMKAVAAATGVSFNGLVTDALVDFVSAEHRRKRVTQFFEEGRDRFNVLVEKLSG